MRRISVTYSREATIRVIIIDDHPMLRDGTQAHLDNAPAIEVIATGGTGSEALRLVDDLRPDVLLLDLRLPDINGVEVARQLCGRFPEVNVVVLTGYDATSYVAALRKIGIKGFLEKTATSAEIEAAVRAVAIGGTAFDATMPDGDGGGAALTIREFEVLRLIVNGKRNGEIAAELCLSIKTVEFHVGNVFSKLEARSRTEAVRLAQARGLV